MTAFMEEYEKQHSEKVCIPGFEMNRPYVPGAVVPGDVGLELEIEGSDLPTQGSLERVVGKTTGSHWLAKTDGSLRGEALEYVLNAPCNIDEVHPLIMGLYAKFGTMRTNLQLSNRCSTHVHVNMTGKKVNEITSAIALWTAFEEPLTLWAGEERVNNHFCLSAKDSTYGTVSSWRSFLRSGSQRFGDNLKYTSQNILPLHRFGSIEYRVMNASEDPDRLIDWTKFIFTLTRYAGDQFNNPRTLLYAMSERGGRDMFRDICEMAGVSQAFVLGVEDTVPDMNRSVLEGFRRAQPLVAGFDWDSWMPEIQKEYVANPFGGSKKKKAFLDDFVVDFDQAVPEPGRGGGPRLTLNAARGRGAQLGDGERALVGAFDGWRDALAPQPATTAPQPPRPAFVPANFVFDNREGVWIHHNYVGMDRAIRTSAADLEPQTVDFEQATRQSVDWTRPVFFAGTGISGYVMKISRDGNQALVRAARPLICRGGNTAAGNSAGHWYSTDTGLFVGGERGYPVVTNG